MYIESVLEYRFCGGTCDVGRRLDGLETRRTPSGPGTGPPSINRTPPRAAAPLAPDAPEFAALSSSSPELGNECRCDSVVVGYEGRYGLKPSAGYGPTELCKFGTFPPEIDTLGDVGVPGESVVEVDSCESL